MSVSFSGMMKQEEVEEEEEGQEEEEEEEKEGCPQCVPFKRWWMRRC